MKGFNSRARVGATGERYNLPSEKRRVSIHAPGWARLGVSKSTMTQLPRFNSRARVGATRPLSALAPARRRFNSRARVGATRRRDRLLNRHAVSIHAPGWARQGSVPVVSVAMGFNSRARVGATRDRVPRPPPPWLFQFTRPGGRDSRPGHPERNTTMFQFTRPGGRDLTTTNTTQKERVSIHAPGWARHGEGDAVGLRVGVSIHAPGWARLDND